MILLTLKSTTKFLSTVVKLHRIAKSEETDNNSSDISIPNGSA